MKLSICCITYNHEKFIAQALDSFVAQQTDFDYEIVIGEDGSTDNTRNICIQFKEKYPHKINLIKRPKNIGMIPNLVDTLNACRGEYIALCEGDDYWTESTKLQKQVAFLDANKDYAICYHRTFELSRKNVLTPEILNIKETEQTFTITDLATHNFIRTPSVVFRNHLIPQYPDWFVNSPVGDYVLHLLNARMGKIKYLPAIMAVYRKHDTSTWSSQTLSTILKAWFRLLNYLLLEFEDLQEVKKNLEQQYFNTYITYLAEWKKENIVLFEETTQQLLEYKFFRDWWFTNIYMDQLPLIKSYPSGLKRSLKHFLKQGAGRMRTKYKKQNG